MGLNPYDGPIGDDPNATTLAFGGMGLTPFGGQQTLNLIWPISRFDLFIPLPNLPLKHCSTISNGYGLLSIVGTLFLEETCN